VNGIKADTQFIEKISAHYIEKSTSNPQLYVVRGLNMGFYTIIAALVLSIDLYADNINILPDVLFYAVTIIAAILLKKSSKRWTVLVVASSLGAVASVAAHIMTDNYFREYSIGSIRRDEQAYYAYYSTLAVYVAEAIISVITVTLLTVIIWDVYKNHGEISRNTDLSTEKRSFYIFAGIFVLLGFFASFADVYRLWSLPFFHHGWIFYYSTVISMALDIIFSGYACYFVGVIRDNIKRNYRLYL
jgi:hypothetical protein